MRDNKIEKTDDEIKAEVKSDPILSQIDIELLSIDENVALLKKYNEHQHHIETQENYADPNRRILPVCNVVKTQRRPTKRCG
jgi:hypothetical protein